MEECAHKNSRIWEPHLAGARKCNDCGKVYNPNREPPWQHEGLSLIEAVRSGKRFRRKGDQGSWYDTEAQTVQPFHISDILATDWEIEEPKKPRMLAWLVDQPGVYEKAVVYISTGIGPGVPGTRAPWLDQPEESP